MMRVTGDWVVRSISLVTASAVFALTGCTTDDAKEADPIAVQEQLNANLPGHIESGNRLIEFGDRGGFSEMARALRAGQSGLTNTGAAGSDVDLDDSIDEPLELVRRKTGDGNALTRFLNERVFIADVYEGAGRFRIEGARVCDGDASCIDLLARHPMVIRASFAEDGLDFALEFGKNHAEPVTIELRPNRIAAVVHLSGVHQALGQLQNLDAPLPLVMKGDVSIELARKSRDAVALALGVRNALEISGVTNAGKPYRFKTQARKELLGASADLASGDSSLSLDLGQTTLEMGVYQSAGLAIDLKGAKFKALSTTETGRRALHVTDIGLGVGVSTVKLNLDTLLSVFVLGGGNGGSFNLSVSADGQIKIAPSLQVVVNANFAPLMRHIRDEIPAWLLGTTYTLTVDGATPTVQSVRGSGKKDGALKVVSGRVKLVAAQGYRVTQVEAKAGQCLVRNENELAAGENALVGRLVATTCPQ